MTDKMHPSFRGGLTSELLRYFSGYSALGVVAFSALVPWFVANFLGWPGNSARLSTIENVQTFWALAATIAVVATFAGSYTVTREYYYRTLRRNVVISGVHQVVSGKYLAALVVGLITAGTGIALWGGVLAFTASPELRAQLIGNVSWAPLLGIVLASSIGSLWGCSVGWIIKHYYATTIFTMLIPLALELPLIANFPEFGRWLPSGALAGIASLPIEGLLDPLPSFAVSLAWLAAAGALVLWTLRKTEF